MPTTGLLHHVEIYVADLKRSDEFWGWFLGGLGYVKIAEWDAGVSYELGETYLVFVQTEKRFLDVPYHRCRVGLNHLAFHARDCAHVDEVTAALRARGATILYPERHPNAGGSGSYAVFFEDPDRIKVELVTRAPTN